MHDDRLTDDEDLSDISLDNADLLNHDALSQVVDDLTYQLVNIAASELNHNPEFRVLFSDRSCFDGISACSPLEFAPGLHDVLSSPDPPAIAFFQALPFFSDARIWAVYAITMEKDGKTTKVYIGSGTEADYGVLRRSRCYYPESTTLPHFVKLAFEDGYHIASFGLLCWTPIPSAGLVPRVRARVLCVEALFTCLFLAAFAKVTDVYFGHLLLWERASVTWKPLCSHSPLKEKIIGDIHMSEEELELISALRVAATARRQKEWRDAKRVKDPKAFQALNRKYRNAANKDKVKKRASRTRENAIQSRRFECTVCDVGLADQYALDQHLTCQAHRDRVADIPVLETSAEAIKIQAYRNAAKAAALHRCAVCDKNFGLISGLVRHKTQEGHKKKAAIAEAAAST